MTMTSPRSVPHHGEVGNGISVWCAEDQVLTPDVAILALSDIHPHRVLEVVPQRSSLCGSLKQFRAISSHLTPQWRWSRRVALSASNGSADVRDLRSRTVHRCRCRRLDAYHVSLSNRDCGNSAVLRRAEIVALQMESHLEELWTAAGKNMTSPHSALRRDDHLRAYSQKWSDLTWLHMRCSRTGMPPRRICEASQERSGERLPRFDGRSCARGDCGLRADHPNDASQSGKSQREAPSAWCRDMCSARSDLCRQQTVCRAASVASRTLNRQSYAASFTRIAT